MSDKEVKDDKITSIRKNKKQLTEKEAVDLAMQNYRERKAKNIKEPDCINSGGFEELEKDESELREEE
ncbi:hypothetical protein [Aliikangiella maris]|uniref:Uncharacterized protein n=2 Tax=Aliikangiella maris TaxID=3162458 RepID=A0ABV2BUG5_9GAMM